ncbi:UNVERIFIED_CONTAM: hypothetical protein FKN15_076358 [Acipenser sinensis]
MEPWGTPEETNPVVDLKPPKCFFSWREDINPLRFYVGPGPTLQFLRSGPMSDPVRHHQKDAKNGFLVVFSPEKSRENHSMAEWERQETRQAKNYLKKGVSRE